MMGWITPAIHGHYAEASSRWIPDPKAALNFGVVPFEAFFDIQRPREIKMTWRTVDFHPAMSDPRFDFNFNLDPKEPNCW